MPAQFYSWVDGDVTFKSKTLRVTDWTFQDEATEIDVTSKADDGYTRIITGKRKGTGTCKAFWNDGATGGVTYGDPPVVSSGQSGAISLLLATGGDSISGTAHVITCSFTHNLEGAFEYEISFTMDGEYLLPGEA